MANRVLDNRGRALVVCDNGTGRVKCGHLNDNLKNEPDFVFPSIVGSPQLNTKVKTTTGVDVQLRDNMCGLDAADPTVFPLLKITRPMAEGQVNDFDAMTHLWRYTFGSDILDLDCSNTKMMLTKPSGVDMKRQNKLTEILFEEFGFAGLQSVVQSIMTLYSQSKISGLCLDMGDGVSHCSPIFNSTILKPEHVQKTAIQIAGKNISQYLVKLLAQNGYNFNAMSDLSTVDKIKEKFAYVSYDLENDDKLDLETTCLVEEYVLPDKNKVVISGERYKCAEALFDPRRIDSEDPGIAELVYRVIKSCPVDNRKELFGNIILSGGTSMMAGLSNRLEKEIKQLYLTDYLKTTDPNALKINIRVIADANREYCVYSGASNFANFIKNQDSVWMMKEDFQEMGAERLIKQKCSKGMFKSN